jgi:NDP-sugar pyrophosphorylase family protein
MSVAEQPAFSADEVYDRCDIPDNHRSPYHFRFEHDKHTQQWYAIPNEVKIEDNIYILTENGALIDTTANVGDCVPEGRAIIGAQAYIIGRVVIEKEAKLGQGAWLEGDETKVGRGTIIGESSIVKDSQIGPDAVIGSKNQITYSKIGPKVETRFMVNISDSIIAGNNFIGTGSQIEDSTVEQDVTTENHVDIVGSKIGYGTKIGEKARINKVEVGKFSLFFGFTKMGPRSKPLPTGSVVVTKKQKVFKSLKHPQA